MPLSLKQLQDVCLINSGTYKKCRYLAQDETQPSKWYCLKKSTRRQDIDDEAEDFIEELKKKNIDPQKQGVPMGDNCDGYPILKNISQGYDQ